MTTPANELPVLKSKIIAIKRSAEKGCIEGEWHQQISVATLASPYILEVKQACLKCTRLL